MVDDAVVPLLVSRKQKAFRTNNSLVRGFAAGVGAGKTWIGALDLLKRAQSGRHYMIIAPTYTMLKSAAWVSFQELGKQLDRLVEYKRSPPMETTITTDDGGQAIVMFRSADDPEKLRGPNLSGIWLDEASIMDEEAYLVSLGRLREGGNLGWLSMTFTPKGKKHWTYRTFYDTTGGTHFEKEGVFLITANTLENPFVDIEFYNALKAKYSSRRAMQELGGEFIDIEGLVIQRAMFGEYLDVAPVCRRMVRAWDKAGTPGGGAYTAGVLMGHSERGEYVILDVKRGQWGAMDRERVILQTANDDASRYLKQSGVTPLIVIEQEPGSGGKESAENTIRMLAGHRVKALHPGSLGSKDTRAEPVIAQIEAGNVRVVNADWTADFIDEWVSWTGGKSGGNPKDQCDATAYTFMQLVRPAGSVFLDRPLIVDLDASRKKPKQVEEIVIPSGRLDVSEFLEAMDH